MIFRSLVKHQKKTALSFLSIFYINTVLPNIISDVEKQNLSKPFLIKDFANKSYNQLYPSLQNSGTYPNISDNKKLSTQLYKNPSKKSIGGPDQPEMKSFQSVNTNNMVDLFTGDFSYNIPLLDVGGYPVSLHYNSGITMDQEASWVGLGWNINPGTINRNMRGLPDDFDGTNDSLKKTQHVKDNKTTGVTLAGNLEIFGGPINVSANLGLFYNNYNGYGLETGVGIGGTAKSAFGSLTGNLSISNNSQTGLNVNPSLNVTLGTSDLESRARGTLGLSTGYNSHTGISSLQIHGGIQSEAVEYRKVNQYMGANNSFPLASISFAVPAYSPSITMPITNSAYSFTGKIGGEIWGTHGSVAFTGYVNKQQIASSDTTQILPAIGYLYSTNGNNRENVLLDMNREKEMAFNYNSTPHIALPQYTYDAYSISGEGTGGSFRPYRGDVGYIFDHSIGTKSNSLNGSIDVGFGSIAHGGLEITNITSSNENHRWQQDNSIETYLQFQKQDTTYEPVYFRNPGEKTTNALSYYRGIGDDSLIRIKLTGSHDNITLSNNLIKYADGKQSEEITVKENLVKQKRDKRTQVITWLNAKDASILGLDKSIKAYPENFLPAGNCSSAIKIINRVDKIHKPNHLSEISVLNSDGRRYIYGLPVYNAVQRDVTFAVKPESNPTNIANGLVTYTPDQDNTTKNDNGKDGYFSKDEIPSYAHSFLLTGILSPDYVDLTGDGITEDDPGDAIKFNYTQIYGIDNGYYGWRTPFQANMANYNEGLNTYSRDDKGTYIYGQKEMWYLNSIESKTMIAVFTLSNDRKDVYSSNGENGGLDYNKSARRLEKIDLYTKANLLKNGASARPIKTVHFSYTYDLCKGTAGNSSIGKLTLNSVWFTYNNNNKGKLNPYIFHYHPDANGNTQAAYNPSYNSRQSDRWGIYKNSSTNPAGMSNADYPYSIQDSTLAAQYASSWHLTDIQLPSGGKMKVTYESDDYAFVQNKRASQMFSIAGINAPKGNSLYNRLGNHDDYYTIYINTATPLSSKQDIHNKYMDVNNTIYFKLAVTVPEDKWGKGIEMVPGYATVEDYGITPGNNSQFWIKVSAVDGRSPMSRAALQFLRLNLPSKAYPGSESGDDLDLLSAIQMIVSSYNEVKNAISGFDKNAKSKNWCNIIDLSRSFIRLSSPNYKKYGGGQRVKRIEIYDNWNQMTGQKESVYGQEYNYTTTENVDGQKVLISSGVASYEPVIGGEENCWHQPLSYAEKTAPMAPVNYMFTEEPIGESFFPSPMVGYSIVRVRTINTKARSANGWEETEYYTSRDFPTLVEHTLLEDGDSKMKYETSSNILRLNHKNHVTLSQGFKIELNDMNGKIKAQSTYAETDSLNPIKYTLNFYKTDNDKAYSKHLNNHVWVVDSTSGHIDTSGQTGKDIEIMVDLREQHSRADTRGFSPNVDVIPFPFFIPFIPIPSFYNFPQSEDTRFRSAAVVKIVQRYGILDSVVVMDKGSVVSTKNLVYDGETGNVVVSRTNNEFNDPIYNYSYPAYWAYSGMGLAYKNVGAVFQGKQTGVSNGGLQLIKGKLYKEGDTAVYPVERFFESGDEIYVDQAYIPINFLFVQPDCRHLGIPAIPWTGKLWVMDASKGAEKNSGLYFIDQNGNTLDLYIRHMKIIRSGKRNMPDASVGTIISVNNPVRQNANGFYIVIDNNSGVLQASASSYKDLWKTENPLYAKDTVFRVLRNFGPLTLNPNVTTKRLDIEPATGKIREDSWITNSDNVASSFDYIPSRSCVRSRDLLTKSLLSFDLTAIPAGSKITSSWIVLNTKVPRNLWYKKSSGNGNFFCPNTYSYDWSKATNYYLGNTASYLRRITNAWSYWDPYKSINVTDVNRIYLDYSVNSGIMCTALIQDMINNGNYGMSFEINQNTSPNNKYETDYLDFCGTNERNVNQPNCVAAYSTVNNTMSLPGPQPIWCDCYAPVLYVNYQAYTDSVGTVCRNYITDVTNPYRWGILGNWRLEKAYTYYNARQESDASVTVTNIRKEGLLKNFQPYWNFTNNGLIANADPTRWVCNSTISEVNQKGAEIENYDPLGRYNSGIYGYNETLPVAIAQNSKYREALFDGFEDYGYQTNKCINCPPVREYDFTKVGGQLTTEQSHSGIYSIKINPGSESRLTVPVIKPQNDALVEALSFKIDSTAIWNSTVTGKGTGITGAYTMGRLFKFGPSFCTWGNTVTGTRKDASINFDWTNTSPYPLPQNGCSGTYQIAWNGALQPKYSEVYTFYFRYSGTATIRIGNTTILNAVSSNGSEQVTASIPLTAGSLNSLSIQLNKFLSYPGSFVQLSWSSASQTKQIIPTALLYPSYPVANRDTIGSVVKIVYYCVKANSVKPTNVIRPVFSPIQGSKLTVGAWVRLNVADCNNVPMPDNVIQVSFTGNGNSSVWLQKTGVRIEGWQRYEANVDVPANANQMVVRIIPSNGVSIYADDIRIQPFNSHVKSYVYNPVNLRLMADLDENNYATFYEYDDDGTLIRVKKETERGIMTIKETRSALLK